MDALDILNRIADLMQKQVDSQTEKAKSGFTESLGIDKDMYDKVKGLVDQFEDSEDAIKGYNAQIKKCDEYISKFDKSINELQDNLKKAKKQQDKDKIQKKIDEKKSDKQDAEARKKKLKDNLNSEEQLRNRAERQFKRKTGKNIAQGVTASSNLRKAMQGIKGGKATSAISSLKGLKANPWMMVAELAIKAVEWCIGKATDYMKLNYENLLRALNASTAVSLNAMKASIASWQDSVTGAYEAQNMAISSQETLLEAQNATELANLRMANTWTNWIPIWGQINKYQETALELEQKVAQTRLGNAHKTISQVNEFTRKTDEYIKKQDKAVRGFQVDRGMSSAQNATFEKWMLGQGESFAKFNKTIEDVLKMQSSYTEQSGRAVNFSENDNLQSLVVGRLVGDESLVSFQSQMQIFNHSVSDSADIMYEMYKDVNKMGLSQKKVTKDVLANLKLANKYDFKNGTKGFIELAKWAENARFNLSSLGNMLEKTQGGGIEGAVTQAAKLQVLGGNFAMYADPLSMFNNALTNPEEYAKQVHSMFKGMGTLDRKTGETSFNGNDHLRIRVAAEALGMSTEDAKNMIREENKKSVVKRQMAGSTLSKKQQDAVANKAQRDEVTGQWYVNTINGGRIDVSNVQEKDLDNIVSDNKDEAAVQYAQSTLSFVEKIEATTKQIDAKLGRLSFDNFGETVNQSNKNTLDYYTENIGSVISAIQTDRKEAIKAQEEQLKKLATIGDDIVKALKTIDNPYEGIDMDKEKQKIDIQEAQNKYRRNIKGRMDTWDEKWNKTVAVNAMERGGDSGWNWWKNRFSAMVQGFTNNNEELDRRARATGYIDKNGKPVAIDEETVKPIHDGIVSISRQQGGRSVSNVTNPITIAAGAIKNVHDGIASITKSDSQDKIVSGNGRPMAVAANKVTPIHDGTASIAKSDPKDSAIFAKTGGPFDTLFNGVFDKINDVYGMLSGGIEHNNKLSPSYLLPAPITPDKVLPSPSNTNKDSTIKSPYSPTQQVPQSNIGKGQFDVNVHGEINLKANGQTFNIQRQLEEDPLLVRAITNMISKSIASQEHGGKSPHGGHRW